MALFETGALVTFRERDWVLLPSDQQEIVILRPLSGSETEICGIYRPLEGQSVYPAKFPLPKADKRYIGDFVSGQLLANAVRLTFRSGAGPFRSLGRLGVRPHPYQLVPLIMALRLNPVRLLIADDVGIGKTIEAGLIVRELIDRGEIRRLMVLCPPHLCEQWQRELREKFALDAVIIRSSTISTLERGLPDETMTIFEHYPIMVASIDIVKRKDRRERFLRGCPECVIVDEAHTATRPRGQRAAQQQRYDLVHHVAKDPNRHLILLTATPHSGIEESFQSLLGLLRPDFETLDLTTLSDEDRDTLARHFVQRRRGDVAQWLGETTPFPKRRSTERHYTLPRSSPYRALFDQVYAYVREYVSHTGQSGLSAHRQRVRYWGALALLRCVMSSPAAARKALVTRSDRNRSDSDTDTDEKMVDLISESVAINSIHDLTETEQENAHDVEPMNLIGCGSTPSEQKRLNDFAAQAEALYGDNDPKLLTLVKVVNELLHDGFHPIVYCRFIDTAKYVSEELNKRITRYGMNLRVTHITGERTEQEREMFIADLMKSPRRVLVATDCLSEGINLQHGFDAVIHYDLPWNPNRLEQREGRVDRYGQRRSEVRTALIYSQDNPIDEAVMKVLLRKAVKIHQSLGISVPLPMNSVDVMNALIATLFEDIPEQQSLFESMQQMSFGASPQELEQQLEQQWNAAAEREEQSRTQFAQRHIKPDEVARELEESDAVLGDIKTVERFVRKACEHLGSSLQEVKPHKEILQLTTKSLIEPVRQSLATVFAPYLGAEIPETIYLTFSTTPPTLPTTTDDRSFGKIHIIGRNHPMVEVLANYLFATAFTPQIVRSCKEIPAARSSIIRTTAISRRTVLLLLRVRMRIIHRPEAQETTQALFAEELIISGWYTDESGKTQWLDQKKARELLEEAKPTDNVLVDERENHIKSAIERVNKFQPEINEIAEDCAKRLEESHQRVRRVTDQPPAEVRPHLPPDLLGVYVLLPHKSAESSKH